MRWEMTGNPGKSRVKANLIEKNEASLTANLRIGCFGCFLCPWKGGKWRECLEALVLLDF